MTKEQLDKLPFDIDSLSKCKTFKEVLSLYPEFNIYEFKKDCGFHIGKALSLIVLLYSKDTWVSARQSSAKINAATHLGYSVENGVIKDGNVSEALMCKNKIFNDMVIRYCRMQYDPDFSEMVIFDNALYNQLTFLNDGKSENSEKTKDIINNISILKKQLSDITSRMLNDNTTKENVATLYEHVEYTSLGIRPEDIAEKLKNGEDPIDVRPYGENYNFAKFGSRERMYVED